jgi:hypothetical protein
VQKLNMQDPRITTFNPDRVGKGGRRGVKREAERLSGESTLLKTLQFRNKFLREEFGSLTE